ncbi:MAG: glycosyltransferase [Nitrospira sp.]|nr:glycosyltransferase [Nitrospira sp.]
MSRKVLMVTHSWPPDACVGAVRPVNIVRATKAYGLEIMILTVQARYYRYRQQQDDNESALAQVTRTRCVPHPLELYRAVKTWMPSASHATAGTPASEESGLRPPSGSRMNVRSILSRIRHVIVSMLNTPDEQLGWLPFAVWRGRRLIQRQHIPCVITTGPPFSAHLVGLCLRLVCPVRWIAEFRDPWVGNVQKDLSMRSALADRCDQWLEALVIRHADRVFCVTESMTKLFQQRYPGEPRSKWVTMPNGFDEDEFKTLGPIILEKRFTITYVGGFNYTRSPQTLLLALQQVLSGGEINRTDLRVRFIGVCRSAGGRSVEEMIKESGLSGLIEIVDLLPRKQALKAMQEAHVLLLLANEQPLQIPGKAYEYLAAGRWILAETEEKSATAQLIRDTRSGEVIEPGDVERMSRAVVQAYVASRTYGSAECREVTDSRSLYSWKTLGARYVECLEGLAGASLS